MFKILNGGIKEREAEGAHLLPIANVWQNLARNKCHLEFAAFKTILRFSQWSSLF